MKVSGLCKEHGQRHGKCWVRSTAIVYVHKIADNCVAGGQILTVNQQSIGIISWRTID